MARRHPRAQGAARSRRARRGTAVAVAGLVALTAAACGGSEPGAQQGQPEGAVMAGPDLRLAATLEPFDSCADVLRWFQDEATEQLGPMGDGVSFAATSGGVPDLATSGAVPNGAERYAAEDGSAASPSPPAQSGAAASPATPEVSKTNVQEAGVDEPDVVKTDGRRLLSVAGDQLRVVDLTGGSARLAGRVTLPGAGTTRIFLFGDRVLALGDESRSGISEPTVDNGASRIAPDRYPTPSLPRTRLTLVDVADPAAPKVTRSILVDGSFLDARLIDGRARVVTAASPNRLPLVHPDTYTPDAVAVARRTNEDTIRRTTIDDWLPRVRPGDAGPDDKGQPLLPCERLRHPKEHSGTGTLSVLSLDLRADSLDTGDTIGLTAGGELVYASDRTLYVGTIAAAKPTPVPLPAPMPVPEDTPGTTPPGTGTTPGTAARSIPPAAPTAPAGPAAPSAPASDKPAVAVAPVAPDIGIVPPPAGTAIHAFAIGAPGPATYRASGRVEGTVNDRWSMSEHAGHLRVVSTVGPSGCRSCAGQQSQVSVLKEDGGELGVVGTAGDMGRGEMVKSVRFIGTRGYVVTFRQVDPLYVLDLADPTHPRVAGELKIPGYSAYLHPVAENLLLGIGQDGSDRGRLLGTKVALYDVSDPASPREIDQEVLPGTSSPVEGDARAFLWWAPTRLAVVPVQGLGQEGPSSAAVGFRVGDADVSRVGQVDLPARVQSEQRSLVVGDAVLTVTSAGVRTSELGTLAPRGWLDL